MTPFQEIKKVPRVRAIGMGGDMSLWDVDTAFTRLYDKAMEGRLMFRQSRPTATAPASSASSSASTTARWRARWSERRRPGCARAVWWACGPMSFTINDECGLLLDAFETPPVLLMSYNPAYYAGLLESCGFRKAQDLLAYRMEAPERVPSRLAAIAHAVAMRGIVVRPLDFGRFDEEVELVHRIHSRAWSDNWGAVPITVDEMRALARELKPLADRDLVFVAEDEGASQSRLALSGHGSP